MGAASSVFGKTPPNLYAMEQLIARYDELRDRNLPALELYGELDKELSAIASTLRLQRPISSSDSEAVDSPVLVVREPGDTSIHILVVDDSGISCKLAKKVLTSLHFNVSVAESGEQALTMLNEQSQSVDLVLLDIVMPQMDGLEALSRIKASPSLQHIPVAMLSGLEDQNLAELCLQRGAVEVLLKPLKTNAVASVVNQHCRQRENSAVPPTPAVASPVLGEVDVGAHPHSFAMAATDFSSVTVPDMAGGKKLLMIFFSAAFVFGKLLGSNQFLTRVNRHYLALKAANTEVVAIGKELPYTLNALKRSLQLQFPVLSDPKLQAGAHYVGTIDYGDLMIQTSGIHLSGLAGYRASHTGLVLLNEDREVMYKWVPTTAETQQEAVIIAELRKVFTLLKDTTPGAINVMEELTSQPTIRNIGRASILVVDDSTISSKLAARKLSSLGHDAMHAENGRIALELLQRFPQDFDLILLDIVMPVMDGVELLTIIKSEPQLQHIPVVMLSGLEDEELAQVCLMKGATDVFKKPLEMEKVQKLLDTLTHVRHS